MKSRLVFIFVFYFVLIPIKTSAEGNSTSYIADSDYLSYRLKVTLDALNDPVIKKLLESGTSVVDMGKSDVRRISSYRELEWVRSSLKQPSATGREELIDV